MNSYKKLHNRWHIELKRFFHLLQGDIPFCENCGSSKPPIDMAHSRKRFDIHTRVEYFHAANLCRDCHNGVEIGKSHAEMFAAVSRIIEKRGSQERPETTERVFNDQDGELYREYEQTWDF